MVVLQAKYEQLMKKLKQTPRRAVNAEILRQTDKCKY